MNDNNELGNQMRENSEESRVSAEDNLGNLLDQIKKLQEEVQKHKDDYLRAIADLENYRRRVLREKEEIRRNMIYSVIEDFLPIMDNMVLGIDSARAHHISEDILQGFEMVIAQFRSILLSREVEELNPVGECFDANVHECVSLIPSEEIEEGKVIRVVRVGYRLKDHLLRPASVIVSSGKANESKG